MNFEGDEKIDWNIFENKQLYSEGGRVSYFYPCYLITTQYSQIHTIWPHTGFIISLMNEHYVKWIFVLSDEDFQKVFDRFWKDKGLLEEMEKYLTEKMEQGVKKIFLKDLNKLTDDDLAEVFDSYFTFYWEFMVTAGTLRILDRVVVKKIREHFLNQSDVDQIIINLAQPIKPTLSVSEELDLLNLASSIFEKKEDINSQSIKEKIAEIVGKYAWGVMGYFDEKPKEYNDYKNTLDGLLKDNPTQKRNNFLKKIVDDKKTYENLVKSLDEKGKELARIASFATYLKDYYKSCINKLEYYAEPLFGELARRKDVSIGFIKDLHPREIIEFALGGQMPDESLVKERSKYNIVIAVPNKLNILLGKDAKKFEERFLINKDIGKKEFKGRVASKGFAKGIAKVVLSGEDFKKFNKGDILIAANTSPDFMPVLIQASGVVAEDGGITAHVSVVSRELGIPCVVGINNATDVFKDGDLVEVDAEKGVVRILNK